MKSVEVSEILLALILKQHSNIEYFLSETMGYILDERSKLLPEHIKINTERTVKIELSDELCDELQSIFNSDFSLSQAVDIVMLCGYVFGGV